MSLCKVYNGALIFRVYVGTVTSVPSITGTWLDICDSNSVSDEQLWSQNSKDSKDSKDTDIIELKNTPTVLRIYASGSHFTAMVEENANAIDEFEKYELTLATKKSMNENNKIEVDRTTSIHTGHTLIHEGHDEIETAEIHEGKYLSEGSTVVIVIVIFIR